jgi:hypothetical protein
MAFESAREPLAAASVGSLLLGEMEARFLNELGAGPGILRDWFSEAAQEMMKPETGLFIANPDPPYTRVVDDGDDVGGFQTVGRILALSLIESIPLGIDLPIMFYASLIGETIALEDIAEFEPEMVRSMTEVLGYSDQELQDYLCGELNINGVGHPITTANRGELVSRKINSIFEQKFKHIIYAAAIAGKGIKNG